MLGYYENFPEVIHSIAQFTYGSTTKKLQEAILQTFHKLNQETFSSEAVSPIPSSKFEVSFEFGVAEGDAFNYLDEEELDRFQKIIAKETPSILDFFCVIRYHILKEGKHAPLKFDYQLLRFIFYKEIVELRISHERGTRRLSLEDLITFMERRINGELSRRRLKPLTLKNLRTL